MGTAIQLEQEHVERALSFARYGGSDDEIALALWRMSGVPLAQVREEIAAIAEELEAERTVYRLQLQEYLGKVSISPSPTSETLKVTMWQSRQVLGYSPGGLNAKIAKERAAVDGKSNRELAQEMVEAALELDPSVKFPGAK